MSRRWTGVALLVGWLSLVGSARAQVPEPIPCAPSMPPAPHASQAPQGPLPPQLAPKGPPSDLLLPADIPGAFTDCPPEEPCDVYFSLGGLGLQRQRPGHGSLVVVDRLNPTNLDTGARPLAERFLTDVQNFHDIDPDMSGGIEGTVGYEWGANAVELTGFWIFDNTTRIQTQRIGRLDLPFFHPPLGFEGDNGMWLQADRVRTSLEQSLGNAEFNYRWWNPAVAGCQGILGLRYTDMEERLNIFTGDDDLTVRDINLRPDPTRQANYRVVSHNHLVAGQLGFEWNYPVCSWVSFSWTGKGAWGANFYDQHHTLTRGDGFIGRATRQFDTFFSHEYEMGVFLDFWLCEGGRLRAGYDMLWLVNVAEATGQVNFDLANPEGQNIRQGSVFYHGPLVELQFLF